MRRSNLCHRQSGAALVVGMVLLFVLTLLSVSAMQTSTLELQMAGNTQFEQNAFQAAEAGLERAMGAADLVLEDQIAAHDLPGTVDTAQTVVSWVDATPNLRGGTSLGAGFAAHHFEATSVGLAGRSATATHRQGFFIVGPDGT